MSQTAYTVSNKSGHYNTCLQILGNSYLTGKSAGIDEVNVQPES